MASTSGPISEELVLSDVHLYNPYTSTKANFALSRFFFSHPVCIQHEENVKQHIKTNQDEELKYSNKDQDGDFIVERQRNDQMGKDVIIIRHTLATPVSSVGTQVWRGSLLLSDFIMHHEDEFDGSVALELGGGVGLCSIVMARIAKKVFCTDIAEILPLCEENKNRNQDLFKHQSKDNDVMIVKELDFVNPFGNSNIAGHWTNSEKDEVKNISVIIASDVIYDDRLTDAFLDTTIKLLNINLNAVLYVALEKRPNFTLVDLQVASPAYDYFIRKLSEMKAKDGPLNAKRLATNFPQYFEYKRVKELELWEIRKQPSTSE